MDSYAVAGIIAIFLLLLWGVSGPLASIIEFAGFGLACYALYEMQMRRKMLIKAVSSGDYAKVAEHYKPKTQ